MVDQDTNKPETTPIPLTKDEPVTNSDALRAKLLLDLSEHWKLFTNEEREILVGSAGIAQDSEEKRDLVRVTSAITWSRTTLPLYAVLIPSFIKRHQDHPQIKEDPVVSEAPKPWDRWIPIITGLLILFLPLIKSWLQKKADDDGEIKADLLEERTRLRRKLEKKRQKAKRVQHYISRLKKGSLETSDLRDYYQEIERVYRDEKKRQEAGCHAQNDSDEQSSSEDGSIAKSLKSPLVASRTGRSRKRFAKGTAEYEKEKDRLDAELDAYQAEVKRRLDLCGTDVKVYPCGCAICVVCGKTHQRDRFCISNH